MQREFSHKADGAPIEAAFEDLVFDQGLTHIADMDMRSFHLPDLAALERLDGDALLLRWIIQWLSIAQLGFRSEENPVYFNEATYKEARRRMPGDRFCQQASKGLNTVICGDDEGFALLGKFSFAAQELDANGAIHFSIGEQPGRHHDIGTIVDFIEDGIFDCLGFHRVRRLDSPASEDNLVQVGPNSERNILVETDLVFYIFEGSPLVKCVSRIFE